MKSIHIPINKAKVILYLLGTLVLFMLSLNVFIEQYQNGFYNETAHKGLPVVLLSIAGVLLFGAGLFVFTCYLFKNKGLIITDKIEDYTNLLRTKILELENIEDFFIGYAGVDHPVTLPKYKPFYIRVNFKKQVNGKKKHRIISRFLKIKPDELLDLLNKRLSEYN